MMQGDSYKISMKITMNGQPLTGISEIEVMLGGIRKTMTSGDITKDAESGEYLISLNQSETFRMMPKEKVKVRVLFDSGDVIGAYAGTLNIDNSTSKVVLK